MERAEPSALRGEIAAATELLERLVEDRGLLAAIDKDEHRRLMTAAGRLAHPSAAEAKELRRELDRRRRESRRETDEAILSRCGIRRARSAAAFETPTATAPRETEATSHEEDGPRLGRPRACYVCKAPFTRVHRFYDSMCSPCGDFNLAQRDRTADLTGRTALVTGARVKIGYQAAIKLLRAGCRVIVTTRFPHDAARRYAREADFSDWSERVAIHGIDLRHTPSVETLCRTLLADEPRLDFILNNACQTVRRPVGFHRHLIEGERRPHELPGESALIGTSGAARAGGSAELSQLALLPEDLDDSVRLFPDGRLDADLQQVDLREVNSWRLDLHEVSAIELLEVHLVNAVAPFVLNGRLKPLMLRTPERDKHIVNVSAMEGQFYRTLKTTQHPHTNMAKAGLNMMTRTSAADYARDGIHMNSVDTGWVTDEDPALHAERKREQDGFHPPLDIVDGAARIVAPIFDGLLSGRHVWGRFLKDYRPTDW
ncbi:MAG: SDR family oxidoreductase [bacterium]|nr:SDR family oxidoreductase [bacterium]